MCLIVFPITIKAYQYLKTIQVLSKEIQDLKDLNGICEKCLIKDTDKALKDRKEFDQKEIENHYNKKVINDKSYIRKSVRTVTN